jgi:hypothetical protein
MSTILVTTVRRNCPPNEPSGYLYAIDWEQRTVLRRAPMIDTPHRVHDPNARGGVRGAKGLTIHGSEVCIGNYSHVFRFDSQWRPLNAITHPSCASIHDIEHDGKSIWVASSRNDLVFQFDLAGKIRKFHDLRALSSANDELGWHPPLVLSERDVLTGRIDFTDPRTHDLETFDAAHINSLCVLANGDVLVSLGIVWGRLTTLFRIKKTLKQLNLWGAIVSANNALAKLLGLKSHTHSALVVQPAKARSAIVRLRTDGTRQLCLEVPGTAVPSHSLRLLADGTVLYLNTSAGEVVHFDPQGGKHGKGKLLSTTRVADGFLRGLSNLSSHTVVMGNKTELLSFDVSTRTVLERWNYTADPNESVFDIKLLPAGFALPPETLPALAEFTSAKSAPLVARAA